jgi:OmpA-OmpF porin, OOP family
MNSNAIKWLLALLTWVSLFTYLCKKYVCGSSTISSPTEISSGASKTTDIIWEVVDGSSFKEKSNQYYHFLKSNSNILNNDESSIIGLNNSLNKYILTNTNKGVNVVGYYKADETNDNTFYANLGLSRANQIKQKLISLGIPSKNITTSAQLLDGDFMSLDTLFKGGDYSFINIEDNSSQLNEIKTRLQSNPIILYFETNSNSLNLTSEQQKQFSDLIYYLDNVPEAISKISGHTDNVGNPAANKKLSQERAEFAKQYLNTNGSIANNRMEVEGYGQTKPISKNTTPEGKAQNRRVEVTIK